MVIVPFHNHQHFSRLSGRLGRSRGVVLESELLCVWCIVIRHHTIHTPVLMVLMGECDIFHILTVCIVSRYMLHCAFTSKIFSFNFLFSSALFDTSRRVVVACACSISFHRPLHHTTKTRTPPQLPAANNSDNNTIDNMGLWARYNALLEAQH